MTMVICSDLYVSYKEIREGGSLKKGNIMEYREHPLLEFWEDESVFHLDVRPLLESGGEPYSHIMSLVQQLEANQKLIIHALFEPKPLIAQLGRMDKKTSASKVGEDHWEVIVSG